ncbi:MAG: RHS repeat-associated core domain-containing protein [Desulfuromonadales bacterium]
MSIRCRDDLTSAVSAWKDIIVAVQSAQPSWTPLYRAYNSTDKSHFYTTDPNEKNGAAGKPGYKFEKIEAYISSTYATGMTPLYRYYYSPPSSTKKFYYYTTNSTPPTDGPSEGPTVVGYVFPNPGNEMAPLYHLEGVSATGNDHFYTISTFERSNAIKQYGYTDKGISAYVAKNAFLAPLAGKPVAKDGGVDLFSGNLQPFYNSVDLSYPQGVGIPFVFARTYNAFNPESGPLGVGWTHNYQIWIHEDGTGAYVNWPDGQSDLYTISGSTYTAPSGVYDTLTNLSGTYTLIRKDKTKHIFKPNPTGANTARIETIEDKNGNQMTIHYADGGHGNIDQILDSSGHYILFSYIDLATSNPPVIGLSDTTRYRLNYISDNQASQSLVRTVRFLYDAQGNLVKSWDPEENITLYEYDPAIGWLSKVTMPKGNTWQASYSGGRVQSVTSDNQVNRYSYNDAVKGTIISSAATTNPSTELQSSSCLHTGTNLKSCSDNKGQTAEILAWDNNNPTQVKDRNGNISYYTYNAKGNITSSKTPLNEITTYDYDASGLFLAKVTDPKGIVTCYNYDANGNVKQSSAIDTPNGLCTSSGNTTYYEYYTTADNAKWNGLLKSVSDPRNSAYKTTYQYDTTFGYPLSVTDAKGYTTNFKYDAWGRMYEKTDPDGVKLTYTYDRNNRVKTISDLLGRVITYTYDANGNVDNVLESPRNVKQQYAYKAGTDQVDTVDIIGKTTTRVVQYDYDPLGRVKSIKNGRGKAWTTDYDDQNLAGQVSKVTTPITSIFDSFTAYDGNGNLKTRVDRTGRTIQSTYDTSNRLKVQAVGTPTYTYTYFPNSLLNTASFQGKTTTLDYTSRGQLKSSADSYTGKSVNYTYDEAGNLKTVTYHDGKIVTYHYDERGIMDYVVDFNNQTTFYDYSPAGRLMKIRYPNGTYVQYNYDTYGRLDGVYNKKADGSIFHGSTVDSFDNKTDVPSQITTTGGIAPVVTASDSGLTVYDDNNRLSSTPGAASTPTVTYSHNNFGERTSKTVAGVTTTYTWDANDLPGRFVSIASGGVTNSYVYDALGNRIAAIHNGTATRYVLSLSGKMANVLAETDGSGTAKAYYVHGLGVISRYLPTNGSTSYYHFDRSGNVVALTDASGNVTDQYTYEADPFAFGVTKSNPATDTNPFTFVGQYGVMDEGSNLFFMRARYYDADAGRFINEDPIGFEGGDLNMYAYVGGNPMTRLDPSGLADIIVQDGAKKYYEYLISNSNSFRRLVAAIKRKLNQIGGKDLTVRSAKNGEVIDDKGAFRFGYYSNSKRETVVDFSEIDTKHNTDGRSESYLAHEMIHAFRDIYGLTNYQNLDKAKEDNITIGINPNWVGFSENMVRKDINDNIRLKY